MRSRALRLDVSALTCDRATMTTRLLFTVLAAGLAVVAWSAWHGGLKIPAVGAFVLAAWLVWMAGRGLRKR